MPGADIQVLAVLGRLGLALVLGSLIGIERQWNQKMAGLRTNALVALGSCGFVVFSAMVGQGDPTRIAAQVVSGIGFLDAGIILREGINVHGLNTAATLWCSAMVGTFAGGGFWLPSIAAAGFVVVTNLLLRPLVRRLNTRALTATDVEAHYTVELTCKGAEEAHMRSLLLHALSQAGLGLRRLDSEDIPDTSKVSVTAQASPPSATMQRSSRCGAAEPRTERHRRELAGRSHNSGGVALPREMHEASCINWLCFL